MTKEDLDKRICDVVPEASNQQTFREFMMESYNEFYEGYDIPNLDDMTDEELNTELDFLDDLWNK